MTNHTFTMTEAKARLVHKVVDGHIAALKNWTLSAVERGDLAGAQELAAEAREYQNLFAAFNMTAKHEIAAATGKALETNHWVKEGRSF